MFFYVYKITNLINNKFYVGMHQTKKLDDGYMGSSKSLNSDIDVFGLDNFRKEILFNFDNFEDMRECEKRIVNSEFVNRLDTYNLTTGGGTSYYYINKHKLNNSKGQCHIVSQKAKACTMYRNWWREQIKSGLKRVKFNHKTFLNKKHSAETIQKMKATSKLIERGQGEKNSQFGTMWITNNLENKKIKKTDIIPDGYHKGRKMSFNK